MRGFLDEELSESIASLGALLRLLRGVSEFPRARVDFERSGTALGARPTSLGRALSKSRVFFKASFMIRPARPGSSRGCAGVGQSPRERCAFSRSLGSSGFVFVPLSFDASLTLASPPSQRSMMMISCFLKGPEFGELVLRSASEAADEGHHRAPRRRHRPSRGPRDRGKEAGLPC
jgi:hypothetical protein